MLLLLQCRLTRIDYYLLLAVKGRIQSRMLRAMGRCWRYSYHAGGMACGRKRYDRLLGHCLRRSQQFRPYQWRLLLRTEIHRHPTDTEALRSASAATVHVGTGGVGFKFVMMIGGRCRTSNGHEDVLPVSDGHR